MRVMGKLDSPRPRFKALRKERGSQREVAEALGVTETYLRHLENGYAVPGIDLAFKTAWYFNVSVYELYPDLADPSRWATMQKP